MIQHFQPFKNKKFIEALTVCVAGFATTPFFGFTSSAMLTSAVVQIFTAAPLRARNFFQIGGFVALSYASTRVGADSQWLTNLITLSSGVLVFDFLKNQIKAYAADSENEDTQTNNSDIGRSQVGNQVENWNVDKDDQEINGNSTSKKRLASDLTSVRDSRVVSEVQSNGRMPKKEKPKI